MILYNENRRWMINSNIEYGMALLKQKQKQKQKTDADADTWTWRNTPVTCLRSGSQRRCLGPSNPPPVIPRISTDKPRNRRGHNYPAIVPSGVTENFFVLRVFSVRGKEGPKKKIKAFFFQEYNDKSLSLTHLIAIFNQIMECFMVRRCFSFGV